MVQKIHMLNDTFKFLRFEPVLDKAIYFVQKSCFAGLCALTNPHLMKTLTTLRLNMFAAKSIISSSKLKDYSPFFNQSVRRIPKMLLKLLIGYLNEQDVFDQIYVKLEEKKRKEVRKIRLKFN